MASQPDLPESDDRVVKFSPRPAAPAPSSPPPVHDAADDRQRMWANLAVTAFAAVLIVVGIWLFSALNKMSKTQDCIMQGLRNCGEISTPPRN